MQEAEKRQRILIVDDSSFNISILGEALHEEYDISVAKNGQEAIDIVASDARPDLILLDIVMPKMDGFQTIHHLKEDDATKDIPVIFITSMSDEEDETKGLAMGAVDYITKPFSTPIVKARVRTHLELKRKTDMLQKLSAMDGLTGIPNRRRFDETFEEEWRRCIREKGTISVVMMDIDYFKKYNDNYGHGEGDHCLRMVAAALAGATKRPADFVARYGGEEFVAILPGTDEKGARSLAEAMRHNVEDQNIEHAYSECAGHVTVSVGLATTTPAMGMARNELVKAADQMLYQAKQNGRNRVEAKVLETS